MKELALTLPGGQTVNPPSSVPSGGINTLNTALSGAITLFMIVGVILSLIFLILGGMQWIYSGGDKSKVQAAQKKITWAVVGLILLMLSFFIINFVGYLFNVNLLTI